jgi:hypothetical protein
MEVRVGFGLDANIRSHRVHGDGTDAADPVIEIVHGDKGGTLPFRENPFRENRPQAGQRFQDRSRRRVEINL